MIEVARKVSKLSELWGVDEREILQEFERLQNLYKYYELLRKDEGRRNSGRDN